MRRAALAVSVAFSVMLLIGAGYVAACRFRAPRLPRPSARITARAPSIGTIAASNQVKRVAAQRVLDERLPLLAAAELFRKANGAEGLERLRATPSGGTLRELLCRQVIQYVYTIETGYGLSGQPPEWSYSSELTAELDCLLATGMLTAPDRDLGTR